MRWLVIAGTFALAGCSAMENAMVDTFINSAIQGGQATKDNEAKILTHATKVIGVGALNRMEPGTTKCGVWLIGGGPPTDSPCMGVVAPSPNVIVVTQGENGQPEVRMVQPPQMGVPERKDTFDPDTEPTIP